MVAAKWNITDTFSVSNCSSDSPIPNPGSPHSPLIGTTLSSAEGLSLLIKSNSCGEWRGKERERERERERWLRRKDKIIKVRKGGRIHMTLYIFVCESDCNS